MPYHKHSSKLVNFEFDSDFLQFFHSYLTNRFQCLKINLSTFPTLVTSAVPQGSVLGTLTFLLFVNDIADNEVNSSFYFFADDPTIFSTSAVSLVMILTHCLTGGNLRSLHFHPTKHKALNFGGHNESGQFLLGADYLRFVNQIKDLGFYNI